MKNLESSLYNLYTIHTTVCKKNLTNFKNRNYGTNGNNTRKGL